MVYLISRLLFDNSSCTCSTRQIHKHYGRIVPPSSKLPRSYVSSRAILCVWAAIIDRNWRFKACIGLYFSSSVEMFWKTHETVRTTTITDVDGMASFELPGEGDYLLNAVQLTEPKDQDVHWASHWASITFKHQNTNP